MKKPCLLIIRGQTIERDFDELVWELTEILQDEFSYFETGLSEFHQRNGFPAKEGSDEEATAEDELYWQKYLRRTDKLREKFCRSIAKVILKL